MKHIIPIFLTLFAMGALCGAAEPAKSPAPKDILADAIVWHMGESSGGDGAQ